MRPWWPITGASSLTILKTFLQLANPIASSVVPQNALGLGFQHDLALDLAPTVENELESSKKLPSPLRAMLNALEVMQDEYFDVFTGTWPSAIDWTAAVLGTHVSATLSSLVSSLDVSTLSCSDRLAWENTIDRYFAHTSIFYFGENAFGLRNQAYDDMLWVVLGWLENIKFMKMYSLGYWEVSKGAKITDRWHGMQFSPTAAHRARIFYDIALSGWDTALCNGGMVWNPRLTPYKNAITNELFIAASISMYLYFPGDNNTSPYFDIDGTTEGKDSAEPHDPMYLENAIKAYKWLRESNMMSDTGLYQDGFHIDGWRRYPNGTTDPGSSNCDVLDTMVYTYNQGVLLTASKGLWITTGARSYLDDGHALVDNVIRATGWPNRDRSWQGLGRDGVMEEFCDHSGYCSQDGQTFKGIFFNHLAEFCRPLWGYEEDLWNVKVGNGLDRGVYKYHKDRCTAYGAWISHNAEAATVTRDPHGLFGMWWGREYPDTAPTKEIARQMRLPENATDHMNRRRDSHLPIQISTDRPASFPDADHNFHDVNDRGRGRSVETQSGGLAVLRAQWQWEAFLS